MRLGTVPGFGATPRLPWTIGLLRALDRLLSIESINAAEAWRIGLLHRKFEAARMSRRRWRLPQSKPNSLRTLVFPLHRHGGLVSEFINYNVMMIRENANRTMRIENGIDIGSWKGGRLRDGEAPLIDWEPTETFGAFDPRLLQADPFHARPVGALPRAVASIQAQ